MTELKTRLCETAKPQPGQRQTDYFDTVVRGLTLRVSAGGTKSWFLMFTRPADGRRARMKLGSFPELGLAAVRQKARDARADIAEGSDPIHQRETERESLVVADMVETYARQELAKNRSGADVARSLRKDFGGRVDGKVVGTIGNVKLSALHRRDITRCLDIVRDRGSPIAAARLFANVRAMIRWARGRGDLDENLTEGMRPPANSAPRERYLTPDEVRQFWMKLSETDMRVSTQRLLKLLLVTGQRVSEVAGATFAEIDMERQLWTLPAARTKNGRQHVVPLSDLALELIKEQRASVEALAKRKGYGDVEWLFPGSGMRGPMTGHAVSRAVSREQDTFRFVEPFTPHDLRRTLATLSEEAGVSPFVVSHILNHVSETKSSITSRVYARYDYAKEKREALELWSERLSDIISRKDNIIACGVVDASEKL